MVGAGRHGSHAEGAFAAADDRGAGRVEDGRQGEQRASGSGTARDGAAGGRGRADVRGGGRGGRVSESGCGDLSGPTVQSGGAGRARDRGRAWTAADLRRGRTGTDRSDGAAATRSEGRWDRHVVALDLGADRSSGGAPARGRNNDPS